jgi:hypothetical protein
MALPIGKAIVHVNRVKYNFTTLTMPTKRCYIKCAATLPQFVFYNVAEWSIAMQATELKQMNSEEVIEFVREWLVGDDPEEVIATIVQRCGERPYLVDLDENAWTDPMSTEIATWLQQNTKGNSYYSNSVIGTYFFKEYSDALQCYLKFYERSETFWY